MSTKTFKAIAAGLTDAIAFAKGDRSRGRERRVEKRMNCFELRVRKRRADERRHVILPVKIFFELTHAFADKVRGRRHEVCVL